MIVINCSSQIFPFTNLANIEVWFFKRHLEHFCVTWLRLSCRWKVIFSVKLSQLKNHNDPVQISFFQPRLIFLGWPWWYPGPLIFHRGHPVAYCEALSRFLRAQKLSRKSDYTLTGRHLRLKDNFPIACDKILIFPTFKQFYFLSVPQSCQRKCYSPRYYIHPLGPVYMEVSYPSPQG